MLWANRSGVGESRLSTEGIRFDSAPVLETLPTSSWLNSAIQLTFPSSNELDERLPIRASTAQNLHGNERKDWLRVERRKLTRRIGCPFVGWKRIRLQCLLIEKADCRRVVCKQFLNIDIRREDVTRSSKSKMSSGAIDNSEASRDNSAEWWLFAMLEAWTSLVLDLGDSDVVFSCSEIRPRMGTNSVSWLNLRLSLTPRSTVIMIWIKTWEAIELSLTVYSKRGDA